MANTVSITVDADTKKAEKSVKGMGDKFRSAMKGVAVAAGAVTLAAGAAAKLGQEYQEATNTIAAGTGASGDQLKGLTKSFKGVWKAVPQDAATVASAIADVNTEMGLEGAALEDVTTAFLDVSRAMGEEAAPMIKSVADAMIAMGEPTENTEKFLDQLTAASQSSGVPMTALADMVVKFGPQLNELGLPLTDATALIANMEAKGLDVGKMMPGLNTAIQKLAKEGVTDITGGLQDAIAEIQNAGTDAAAMGIAMDLFGAGAGIRFKDAIDKGAFSINGPGGMIEAMENADGKVSELAATTLTTSDKFDIMKNRVKETLSPIGNFATALGPMVIMLPAIATGISAMAASTVVATAATWLMTAAATALAVVTSPIGLIVIGIALAIAGIVLAIKNWDKVTAAFSAVWDAVWSKIKPVFEPIANFIKETFESIEEVWGHVWAAIRILAIVAWEKISEKFTEYFGWALPGGAIHTALNKIKEVWDSVWAGVQTKFDAVAGFIGRLWEDHFGWLRPGGALFKALDDFKEKWASVWEAVKGLVRGPVNFIVGGINKLIDVFNALDIGWPSKKVRGVTVIPAFKFAPFNIPHVPMMAQGGIVTKPTLAMIGENGPEAVVPLGRGGAGGITINILGPTYGFDDFEERVSEAITDGVRRGGFSGVLAPA